MINFNPHHGTTTEFEQAIALALAIEEDCHTRAEAIKDISVNYLLDYPATEEEQTA